jgi:hypothetical protein
MIIEGKGHIAPSPKVIELDEDETKVIRIRSKLIAEEKGYNPDNAFIGWIGEGALAKYLREQLGVSRLCDACSRPYGDSGIDMTVRDVGLQVKTHRQGGSCAIARVKDRKLREFKFDIIVFCEMRTDSLKSSQSCALLGYIFKKQISKWGIHERTPRGYWHIRIDPKYLSPMARLPKYLEAKGKS